MRIFLTGSTGYLGDRLLRALLAAGHQVRVLVRDPGRLPEDLRDRLEIVQGDLLVPPDPGFLEGQEALIHTAAMVRTWARDRRLFERVNVEGFRRLVEAALEAGVRRILHTSSFMALGPARGGVPVDEEASPWEGGWLTDYARTKALAEKWSREAVAKGAPIVTLYPAVIYGPGRCTDGNLLGKLAFWILHGKFPGLLGSGRQRWTLSFVEDVVRGHLLALEKARPGDRFILGGPEVRLGQLVAKLHEMLGRPPRFRRLPVWSGKIVGGLQILRARLGGPLPELTPSIAEVYAHDWVYSSRRAQEALGYQVTPLEEGLERTVRWVRGLSRWGEDGG
jgi:farnesol dehydrogenase